MKTIPAVALLLVAATAAAAAPAAGEHLYLELTCQLPGWTLDAQSSRHEADYELNNIFPAGQTALSWTDRVSVLSIYGKPARNPAQMLQDELTRAQQDCEFASAGPVTPVMENGYPTAMRAIACTKSKKWGKGEVDLYKVLNGAEASYVVVRAWSGPPFAKDHVPVAPEVTLKWLAFMQAVVLCDSRDPQRPCPAPNAHCPPAAGETAAPKAPPPKP